MLGIMAPPGNLWASFPDWSLNLGVEEEAEELSTGRVEGALFGFRDGWVDERAPIFLEIVS
jgi:hypothetical protein